MDTPRGGWLGLVLVALMMLVVAWSIQAADYAPGLSILTPLVVGGVVVGAILGATGWLPAPVAHGWGIVLGLTSIAALAASILPEYSHETADASFAERISMVRDWYLAWLSAARVGASISEPLIEFAFVISMAMLLWLLAYICAWFVVRYVSWWGAVLPSGFALMFNLQQVQGENTAAVAFFLVCALLLAEQTHLVLKRDSWRREHVTFPQDIGFDHFRDGLLIALVVVATACLAPQDSGARALRQWTSRWAQRPNALQERLDKVFPGPSLPDRGGGTAFGSSISLGGSVDLGNRVIFEAGVSGSESAPRYWRMAVFDVYEGRGWRRTSSSSVDVVAGKPVSSARVLSTTPVTQTIRVFQEGTTQLFAAPQPLIVGVDVSTEIDLAADGGDPLVISAKDNLQVGETYQVLSLASAADVGALRAVASADPEWVGARYMQLPASLPQRVADLAAQVAAGTTSRFDAASAIEAYLRSYEYSEEIDEPPENRDLVDWFLFDERRGYCDYYSSAFVVMARAVGVPARVAVGYSTGEFVAATATFRQHEFDAHSWPEVYFPGYGWIEFEPTGTDALIDRPAGLPSAPEGPGERPGAKATDAAPLPSELEDASSSPGVDTAPAATAGRDLSWLLRLAGGLGAVVLAASVASMVWLRPYRGLTAAQGAFARVTRVAAWLRMPPGPAETPDEFAARLAQAVPKGSGEIHAIVDAFVRERFGRQNVSGLAAELRQAWSRLRPKLLASAGRLVSAARRRR